MFSEDIPFTFPTHVVLRFRLCFMDIKYLFKYNKITALNFIKLNFYKLYNLNYKNKRIL